MSDFKAKAADWLRRLGESSEPVIIGQNGKAAAVVLSPAAYDELTERLRFMEAVERGLADVEAGRVTHWSDRAKDDLAAIGEYIAAVNPTATMRWVDRLIADVERRRDASRRTDRARVRRPRDIREVLRRTYRIVYRLRDEAIEVLTIFEGHRLFPQGAFPEDES